VWQPIFFLFGLGDRSKLTDELTTEINERVQVQYEYLRDFATAILAGTLSIAMINARSKLLCRTQNRIMATVKTLPMMLRSFRFIAMCWVALDLASNAHERRQKVSSPWLIACYWAARMQLQMLLPLAYYRSQDDTQRESMKRYGWLGNDSLTQAITMAVN
jgi:hypothetical protein